MDRNKIFLDTKFEKENNDYTNLMVKVYRRIDLYSDDCPPERQAWYTYCRDIG